MNHLAHFLLAPGDDEARMGTLLGDFVRGTDLTAWPAAVESAIRLHRRVDSITDTHPALALPKSLAAPHLRRYAGILLDVFFDHMLIAQWPRWSATPLDAYCAGIYASLARTAPRMPPPARALALRMGEHDILQTCATRAGVSRVLARIATRLSRPVALAEGIQLLDAHYAELETAFEVLLPVLRDTAAAWPAAPAHDLLRL